MTTPQAALLFVGSWALALLGLGCAFSFGSFRGETLARYTGNTIMLGLLLVVLLPIALGAFGITSLWGFWR